MTDTKLLVEMVRVSSGADALALLLREPPYADADRPDLILLDLNMPGMSGQEVLAEIRTHPELRRIPVTVLTASSAEADIAASYDLGANCYVQKPVDLTQFERIVASIQNFWFQVVKLPPVG